MILSRFNTKATRYRVAFVVLTLFLVTLKIEKAEESDPPVRAAVAQPPGNIEAVAGPLATEAAEPRFDLERSVASGKRGCPA